MLDLNEVEHILREKAVPDHIYSIGGLGSGDLVGIRQDETGQWQTYYSEKGSMWDIRNHATEDAACRQFLGDVEQQFEFIFKKTIQLT